MLPCLCERGFRRCGGDPCRGPGGDPCRGREFRRLRTATKGEEEGLAPLPPWNPPTPG